MARRSRSDRTGVAGSGGAVIGVYRDEAMFNEISDRMAEIGSLTVKPIVTK